CARYDYDGRVYAMDYW
nr:immunoglobulin heavy chain junction region [Mus musculus]